MFNGCFYWRQKEPAREGTVTVSSPFALQQKASTTIRTNDIWFSMVFHLVNSDCRMTGTVAFKTFQWQQSESREWSLHLIPIGHLGLFLRVEWVGIVTDKFTMELFGTLVLIISPITRLRRKLGLNSFPKQVPWCNSIKTLIQSSTTPQNGYQILF